MPCVPCTWGLRGVIRFTQPPRSATPCTVMTGSYSAQDSNVLTVPGATSAETSAAQITAPLSLNTLTRS